MQYSKLVQTKGAYKLLQKLIVIALIEEIFQISFSYINQEVSIIKTKV